MSDTPEAKLKVPRGIKTVVPLGDDRIISVYAGKRISHALIEVSSDMNLYKGVRLRQLLEAVYDQGKKDGSRETFDKVDALKDLIPHRNPGQPKKRKKQASQKSKRKKSA